MVFANRLGLGLAAFLLLSEIAGAAQLTIQGIQLFNGPIQPAVTNRADVANAIDGNASTFSYITPSGSLGVRYAGLDLGNSFSINRLQVNKAFKNIDGTGAATDPMDLQLLYTTDTGPLISRTYQPVTGLTNGYLGSELITADSVNSSDATVVYDTHQGIYSLSFDSIAATGLALRFDRNVEHDTLNNHYPVYEFTPMNGAAVQAATAIDVFIPYVIPAGTLDFNRGDQMRAIDGDIGTFSYLTKSGTTTNSIVSLDLGAATSVQQIRVAKRNQISGFAAAEAMNLEILYTTDTGPLNERTYQPVAGLTSGVGGTELIIATAVNSADGTVVEDLHNHATDGFYSLSFDAVNATAIAVRFAKPAGAALPWTHYPTYEFELYGVNAVPHAGDFDSDGDVDGADFVAWQTNFPKESGATLDQGDADGDGDVDGADFVVWQTNFPFTPGPGTSPVPEPSSLILIAGGLLAVIAARRHRSST